MSNNTIHYRGELKHSHPLQRFTAWRVGGPAEQLYLPADKQDLSLFLSTLAPTEATTILGLGSNTLIRDGGIAGTVIVTQGKLHVIECIDECIVYAEAGVSCATLARYCARLGLTGLEFLAGIPGTVGGALAMNAGCFGSETWETVTQVETINSRGHIHLRSLADYQVAYRSVKRCFIKETKRSLAQEINPSEANLPNESDNPQDFAPSKEDFEFFTAGYFRLKPGDKETSLEKIRHLLEHRAQTQPINEFNCGSTFRNPPGDHAGRLIEAAGLKGLRLGGARVSEKHANFIINEGLASAADIELLIEQVAEAVYAQSGVRLQREVHILGDKSVVTPNITCSSQ